MAAHVIELIVEILGYLKVWNNFSYIATAKWKCDKLYIIYKENAMAEKKELSNKLVFNHITEISTAIYLYMREKPWLWDTILYITKCSYVWELIYNKR